MDVGQSIRDFHGFFQFAGVIQGIADRGGRGIGHHRRARRLAAARFYCFLPFPCCKGPTSDVVVQAPKGVVPLL